MRLKLLGLVGIAALVGALPAAASASSPPDIGKLMGKGGDYARDCTSLPSLDPKRPSAVRYVVWCGVQTGRVRFSVRRSKGAAVLAFPRRLTPAGSGADGNFHCRRVIQTVKCEGEIEGPVVIRGWIVVQGNHCIPVAVHNPGDGPFGLTPRGCPGTQPPRPPRVDGYMRSFRREFGLDVDLNGDKKALEQRMRDIVQAWKRGAPVERVMYQEYGLPLSPQDQRWIEYRDEYLNRDSVAIERWAARHARSTFAGWDIDDEHGGIFYIGFVGDQEARIAEFESQVKVLAPDKIKPFPTPPKYSEERLEQFEEELLDLPFRSKLLSLINSIGTDVLANRVEVGTEHVALVRRLLAERFGPENPALVVFEKPIVLL